MTKTRYHLFNSDYTATPEGLRIKQQWEALCREFVASLPNDIELTDVQHLCSGQLSIQMHRRILSDRRVLMAEARGTPRMTRLDLYEALAVYGVNSDAMTYDQMVVAYEACQGSVP
jgi:hypothetical protein